MDARHHVSVLSSLPILQTVGVLQISVIDLNGLVELDIFVNHDDLFEFDLVISISELPKFSSVTSHREGLKS